MMPVCLKHKWTAEQDADLLRLASEQQFTALQLAEYFRVTTGAAEQRLYYLRRKLRAEGILAPTRRPERWSDFDNERLLAAVTPGQRFSDKAFHSIAKQLNRSPSACRSQYRLLKAAQVLAEVRAARTSKPHRTRAEIGAAAKAARQAIAEPLSLTAAFFGDPRPGQSALDKKRLMIADPEYFDPRASQMRTKPTLAWEPMR